jgi:penicillin-binding protein 1A
MRGVVNRGTGTAVKTRFGIVADIAGKTGTTQNNTDGWFILMHPNLVAGSWVGFNDSRVTMRSNYWGQGGHNAILVVGDFFRAALKIASIDVKAQFPRPTREVQITAIPEESSDTWEGDADSDAPSEQSSPDATAPSNNDKNTPLGDTPEAIIIKRGNAAPEMPVDELERGLSGMGRDPATGARVPVERVTPEHQ